MGREIFGSCLFGIHSNAILLDHHRIRAANSDGGRIEVGLRRRLVIRIVRPVLRIVRDQSVGVLLALHLIPVSHAFVT